MNCRETQERLVDLFDSTLPADAAEIESHLASCESCAPEYASLQAAVAFIKPRMDVRASPDFKERVMKKITEVEVTPNRWSLIPRLAWAGAAALLVIGVLFAPHGQSPAISLLAQSAVAMSNLQSVHIFARMRTDPKDNFDYINPEYDWVPLEIWKQFGETPKWRVEKPGRVAVMDGSTSLLLIRPNHGVRAGRQNGFLGWLSLLLSTDKIMERELASARRGTSTARLADGYGHTTLAVKRAAQGDYTNDWLLNKSVSSSNHTRVYRFDTASKRLEGMQLVLHANGGDVTVFEITDIRYNETFDPSLFTVALPEDVIWGVPPEQMPTTRTLPKSPREAAVMFFEGLAREDWDQVLAVYPATRLSAGMKDLGGLQVVSVGEPFQSGLYRGWFVPYEVRLKSGYVKKHNVALRNDNRAGRWVVDGGY